MENFAMLFQGFGTALTPMTIGACLLGAVLGLVVGAMPGIALWPGVPFCFLSLINSIRRQLLLCSARCIIPICMAVHSVPFF